MESRSRVGKESLALAVRKDFNAQAVSEMEVVTGFLYAVRNQSTFFPPLFLPSRSRFIALEGGWRRSGGGSWT